MDFGDVVDKMTDILAGSVVNLLFALAFVYFFWGVVQYVMNSDNEKKEKGKQAMIWGIIGLFVMFAVWGMIRILDNTFFADDSALGGDSPDVPYLWD